MLLGVFWRDQWADLVVERREGKELLGGFLNTILMWLEGVSTFRGLVWLKANYRLEEELRGIHWRKQSIFGGNGNVRVMPPMGTPSCLTGYP